MSDVVKAAPRGGLAAADALDRVAALLDRARRSGADAADAVFVSDVSVEIGVRNGLAEHVERAETQALGLRVFVGHRAAIVSAGRLEPGDFARLAERAVAMARVVPEDPHIGLAGHTGYADAAGLDLADDAEPDVATLTARALEAEAAAVAVHGVTQSGEASAGFGRTAILLATSEGFRGAYRRTGHAVSASALAGTGSGMQRDYDYHSAVHLADLDAPAAIGRSAGERAVTRLDPGRPTTGQRPVIYDPRVAGSLVGHLLGAINGAAIARGTSFLKDRLGSRIMRQGITILDDPRRIRGLRSRPFDGEGAPTAPLALVEDGILRTWLLDTRSARLLGLRSTASASRGTSGPPSPSSTNVTLQAADAPTPADLMADITDGLYVTELLGASINGITGDYSRGAAGFAIRNGALAEPVAEITIAGNLVDMLATLRPANDLTLRRGTDSPTVRIDGLTVAGA